MTPAGVISEVRGLLQDDRAPYRYSDELLLQFVNNTVRKMSVLRPDVFTVTDTVAVVAGQVDQQLPTTATRLIDILYVVDGGAVQEVDKRFFNDATTTWVTDAAGVPVKFMRNPRNPRGYYLYPKPQTGTSLVVQYSTAPLTYALNDDLAPVPDSYLSTLVDGVVYLASSIDDEHVSSGRAELFGQSFLGTIRASYEADGFLDGAAVTPRQTPEGRQ